MHRTSKEGYMGCSSLLAAQAAAFCQRAVRVFRPFRPADPEGGVVLHALRQHRRPSEHLGQERQHG